MSVKALGTSEKQASQLTQCITHPDALQSHFTKKLKLEELEKKNIIVKETERTDWISSVVVVAKPGKIRICLDPKDLNKAVRRPKYQMSTLEEVLPKLSKAKAFTTKMGLTK